MRGSLLVSCAVSAMLCSIVSADVGAQQGLESSRRAVEEGERRYFEQDYEGAIEAMSRALEARELTTADRLAALEILACSHLSLGRERQARNAFAELVDVDPFYRLQEPTGSPRLRRFFESVRDEMARDVRPRDDVRLDVRVVDRHSLNDQAEIEVDVEDPDDVVADLEARVRGPVR